MRGKGAKPDTPREPGWYPDPWSATGDGERYFDGKRWGSSERPRARHGTPEPRAVTRLPSRTGRRLGRARPLIALVVLVVVAVAIVKFRPHSDSSAAASPHAVAVAAGMAPPSSREEATHTRSASPRRCLPAPAGSSSSSTNPTTPPHRWRSIPAVRCTTSSTPPANPPTGKHSCSRPSPGCTTQPVSTDSGKLAYVTGEVVLDGAQLDPARLPDRSEARAIIQHELGDLVGLDHTADQSELMYSEAQFNVRDHGVGDRRGLALLGTQACYPEL